MRRIKMNVDSGKTFEQGCEAYLEYSRMDEDLKKKMEKVCSDMGMSMTTAFTIFAKTVTREKRIPFEVTADPFYSDSNLAHLHRGIKALNEGKGVEHDLIEDET